MSLQHYLVSLCLVSLLYCATDVQAQQQKTSAKGAFCPNSLSTVLCDSYIKMLEEAAATNPQSVSEFRNAVSSLAKSSIQEPAFWNAVIQSPVLSNKLSQLPLTLEFKLLDRDSADTVIGMAFSYSKAFNQTTYNFDGDRERSYQFQLDIDGVVTQNADENPRNFITGKVAVVGRSVPAFNLKKLKAGLVPDYCDDAQHIDDTECFLLQTAGLQAFFEPMGATFYLDYGVDLGYETDQEFDGQNSTLGGFVFVAYEDMRVDTFIGYNNIKPSMRLGAETVDPNSLTPRSMAGDSSAYIRLSGEFSLIVPLQKLANLPYYFTFNYQAYQEVGASDLVKSADLDGYQLRTYSLNTPTGIFVSYSSGRLPFSFENESTVELGFQTHF